MEKLILKCGHRIPELVGRALAGDVSAIIILAALGITAATQCLKDNN